MEILKSSLPVAQHEDRAPEYQGEDRNPPLPRVSPGLHDVCVVY